VLIQFKKPNRFIIIVIISGSRGATWSIRQRRTSWSYGQSEI